MTLAVRTAAAMGVSILAGGAAVAPAVGEAQNVAALTSEDLIGTWSFDGSCASSDGMGLAADGEIWFDEWGWGLWVVEGDAILMILQESEMGIDVVVGVTSVLLRIDGFHGDRFSGTFARTGQQVEAVRCS